MAYNLNAAGFKAAMPKEEKTTYEDELHRVVVHSVLHLIGFKDKSDADAKEMRQNENHCLELLKMI